MTQAVLARIEKGAVVVPDKLLLSQTTIATALDVSVRTLERWRAVHFFPEPDKYLGTNDPRWRRETVLRWIDALPANKLMSGG